MGSFGDLFFFVAIYDRIELRFDIYNDGEVDKAAEGLCYEIRGNPLFSESRNYSVPSVALSGASPKYEVRFRHLHTLTKLNLVLRK
jgi:hypothetical protein